MQIYVWMFRTANFAATLWNRCASAPPSFTNQCVINNGVCFRELSRELHVLEVLLDAPAIPMDSVANATVDAKKGLLDRPHNLSIAGCLCDLLRNWQIPLQSCSCLLT